MHTILHNDPNIDVVYGVFSQRDGGIVRGFMGKIFFNILNNLSEVKISKNQTWQRLMRLNYVKSLLLHKEYESLAAGLMSITGYTQKAIEVKKTFKGTSSYNFKKRFLSAISGLTAFSSKPLVYIAILGFFIALCSSLFIFYVIFCKLFIHNFQAGWITLITSIWLVGGLIMLSVGILGIYISKIFNQTKNRPLYIIKNTYKK
jgi:putative glycosyltransferase